MAYLDQLPVKCLSVSSYKRKSHFCCCVHKKKQYIKTIKFCSHHNKDSCLFKIQPLNKLAAGLPTGINHHVVVLLEFINVFYSRQAKESKRFKYNFCWSKLIGSNWPLNISLCFLFSKIKQNTPYLIDEPISFEKCLCVTNFKCGFSNICPIFWFILICEETTHRWIGNLRM